MKQFFTYSMVGATGTIVHYALLLSLVELLTFKAVTATTIGFIAGALINYILNYKFTFSSKVAHTAALPKFISVAILGGIINTLIMFAGTTVSSASYLVIQLVATCIVLFTGFYANKYWSFSDLTHNNNHP